MCYIKLGVVTLQKVLLNNLYRQALIRLLVSFIIHKVLYHLICQLLSVIC